MALIPEQLVGSDAHASADPLLEADCMAGFASHPSHHLPSLQIVILGHGSKKLHLMFPVNAAKEDRCQWDGYFTALPSSPTH